MKNRNTILLTISLLCMFSCTKDDSGDLFLHLDNFRLVKVLNYSNSTDTDPYTYMDLEYSVDGNLQKELLYDHPNTLFTYREFDYRDNLLIEKRIFDGQVGNLTLGTYKKYEYDGDNIIKVELYLADGTLKRTVYSDYEGENLVNTYKVDNELGIHHQYKYTYNDLNLLILEEQFMYDQKLSGFTKYSYDSNMRLIKTEVFNFDETIYRTIEHKYNGDNKLPIEELYYAPSGDMIQHRKLIYDDFNNLTEIRIINSSGNHPLFKKTFNGKLLIEHIQYLPTWDFKESSVTRYEYEIIQ